MNASSTWRKESQASVELWAKALDLPTRSELNTLMRRVNRWRSSFRLEEPASVGGAAFGWRSNFGWRSSFGLKEAARSRRGRILARAHRPSARAAESARKSWRSPMYMPDSRRQSIGAPAARRRNWWESGKLRLFRYQPTAPSSGAVPLLIVMHWSTAPT